VPSNRLVGHGSVGLPIGHAVSLLCEYHNNIIIILLSYYHNTPAGGYASRRDAVIGYMALLFPAVGHSVVGFCSHILCR